MSDGRPKPCCICLDEKKVRDECMFEHEDGMTKCKDLIEAHRKYVFSSHFVSWLTDRCMAGFGYHV